MTADRYTPEQINYTCAALLNEPCIKRRTEQWVNFIADTLIEESERRRKP